MLTTYSISCGADFIITTIKPLYENSSINERLRIGKSDIQYIKETIADAKSKDIAEHLIFTLARVYSHKVVTHIVEAAQLIEDKNVVEKMIMQCKKMDKNEVQIMDEQTYVSFLNELTSKIQEIFKID